MNKEIFFLIIFNFALSEIIKIPFGIINTEKYSDIPNLISKLVYNRIYINMTVGTPPKEIKLYLRKDSYALFIHKNNFNKTLSESFESNNKLNTFFLDIYTTGYFSKDFISFGNYKNNNNKKLDFILSESDDNSLGALGFKIPFNFPEGLTSFLENLKNNSIISSPVWTLKYYYSNKKLIESINDIYNPIGELIIGGDPHEYEENKIKYSIDEYNYLEAPAHNRKYYWDLKFKSIYIYTLENEKIEVINNNYLVNEVNLKAEYSVIWGTKVYYDIIHTYFFIKYKYIENNICQEKKVESKSNLKYIECINDDKLFQLKNFPSIYFESFEFNKIFELTYEDLFVLEEETNKYIFLIVFPTNYVETTWSLGIPFLRKYQFTFNEDKKVIGFYNTKEKKEDENNNNVHINNNSNNNNKIGLYILFGSLFVIFCVLLIFLGMFIHKWLFGEKRRKKANELDDGFDYDTKESINTDKNIIQDNDKKDNLISEQII
jgi:hypothetical protein